MNIFNFIRRIFFGFNKLESVIFSGLLEILNEDEKVILKSQLRDINKIVRHPEGIETLFYKVKLGNVSREFKRKFDAEPGVQVLAEMQIAYFDRVVPVKVFLFDGVVYRFEYGEAKSTMLDADNYTILEAKKLKQKIKGVRLRLNKRGQTQIKLSLSEIGREVF